MRVGIDLSPLFYGNRTRGIGVYAENLTAALIALDATNEYVLLTTRGTHSYTLPFALTPNVSIVALPAPSLGRATPLVSHQIVLPLRARALKLDVLHMLQVPYNPSHPSLALWQRVPTIVTLFDVMPLEMENRILKNARYRGFYKFQLYATRRAAHIITATEFSAHRLVQAKLAPREKISVVPLAGDASAPSEEGDEISRDVRAVLQRAPFFLHVGGDEPQKNQATVLRAFGMLCRNPAFKHNLVLVGEHHLPDALALEQSSRAALRILRVTNAARAELDALYEHCTALVFPSLYEGFGLPVLEAMRAAAPVITSNVSCLPEVAGGAAMLVSPQDANAVANAMRRVLGDERLRVKLSEAGERRAHEFSWTRTAEMTRAVYEQVAQGSRSRTL